MRIAFFDIETTHLKANFGIILCACIKWSDREKTVTFRIDKSPNYAKTPKSLLDDRWVCDQASQELIKADQIVTHYGKRFDQPFLNTRLAIHRLPPFPRQRHVDTWEMSRRSFAMHSNRLQALIDQFGERDKTSVSPYHWMHALVGDKKSLNYVVEHCKIDVEQLEEVYNAIKPYDHFHPTNCEGQHHCHICRSTHLQSRGYQMAHTRRYQRFQCQDCGAWSRIARAERGGAELR